MPRPRKATVDYFPHYVTGGKTIFSLESEFGNDGYAFWFKLLELLGQSEHHYYDCNKPCEWRYLLSKTRFDEQSAVNILAMLSELEAIDPELWAKKIIWSQNFVTNLSTLYSRREIEPYNKSDIEGLCTQKLPLSGVSVSIYPQSKGEERKGKESIVKDTISPKEIVTAYHDICKSLPTVQKLTDSRLRHLKARFKQYPELTTFELLFKKAEASDFLTGADGKWKAGFDWLINEANMIKVLEGNYDNKSAIVEPKLKHQQTDFTTVCPACRTRVKPTEIDIVDGNVCCTNCRGVEVA